jgi:hypothetical protein
MRIAQPADPNLYKVPDTATISGLHARQLHNMFKGAWLPSEPCHQKLLLVSLVGILPRYYSYLKIILKSKIFRYGSIYFVIAPLWLAPSRIWNPFISQKFQVNAFQSFSRHDNVAKISGIS